MESKTPDLRALAEEALLAKANHCAHPDCALCKPAWSAARERLFEAIEEREAMLRRVEALADYWDRHREIDCLDSDLRDLCAEELKDILAGKDGPQ